MKVFRWVHPSLYEGVSVRPSDGPSDGWMVTRFFPDNRNHWGRPTLTLLKVLNMLKVLNVLNMPIGPIAQGPIAQRSIAQGPIDTRNNQS